MILNRVFFFGFCGLAVAFASMVRANGAELGTAICVVEDGVLRECKLEESDLSEAQRREKAKALDGARLESNTPDGIPVMFRVAPGPYRPGDPVPARLPMFEAVKPEDRVEYTGPPVIGPDGRVAPVERPVIVLTSGWIAEPQASDFERLYPRAARRSQVSGDATIECDLNETGALDSCVVLSESDVLWGFGEATLEAVHLFRRSPATVSGQPVRERVMFTVYWKAPE